MRIRRWGQSALVSFAVALVATVSLAPVTATAEPTPTPTSTQTTASVPATASDAEAVAEAAGTPPVLTSLAMVSAAKYAGDRTTISYAVSDEDLPLQSITLGYSNLTTASTSGAQVAKAAATGSATVDPPLLAGVNRFDMVTIFDASGAWSVYRRDGSVSDSLGNQGTHTIDFSKLNLTVLPGTPDAAARSMPRAIGLAWWHTAEVRKAVSGYRVTVSPGGSPVTVPVNADYLQTYKIAGLTNGTAYTVSVTPLSQWGDGRTFTRSITPLPSRHLFGSVDVNGDRKADVFAQTRNPNLGDLKIYLYPGNGTGGFGSRSVFEAAAYEVIAPGGDTNSDGRGDLLYVRQDGVLETMHRSGGAILGRGWGTMRFIDGGADFSGDRRTDILAVTRAGELYLYRLGSDDRITSSSKLGSGWGSMHAFFTPGDFSGDGKADIVAMDAAGDLWLYRGTGSGGFLSRLKIGVGWAGFGAVLPMRDFNGDGRADIGAVTMSGDLLLYPGNGRSGFHSSKKIGTGWHAFF